MRPRKIDRDALNEMRIKRIAGALDEEYRRRKKGKVDAEIPTPNRMAGETDITDFPTNSPWQREMLEQTGKAFPLNQGWICPRCGQPTTLVFPPRKCSKCGLTRDEIMKDLNLRK